MLKHFVHNGCGLGRAQPPSGGCVLKQSYVLGEFADVKPAAFRRLCVETNIKRQIYKTPTQPPSGGCVLKRR